ncbi:MAG: hypothetical protein R2864_02100 [Syntrophotaleaceae bacterium]
MRIKNPLKAKQMEKGLKQLAEEGAVQLFRPLINTDYILGAVGVLQFDVIMSRLQNEYGVDALYEGIDYATAAGSNAPMVKKWRNFREKIRPTWPRIPKGAGVFGLSEWRLGHH